MLRQGFRSLGPVEYCQASTLESCREESHFSPEVAGITAPYGGSVDARCYDLSLVVRASVVR